MKNSISHCTLKPPNSPIPSPSFSDSPCSVRDLSQGPLLPCLLSPADSTPPPHLWSILARFKISIV